MKVMILKRALITVEPGSVVEISESQFKALGDRAALIDEPVKAAEVVQEVPKEAKPSTSKRTSRKKREE